MKKVLDFIDSVFKRRNLTIFILLATIAILAAMNFKSCKDRNEDKRIYEQNLEAMKKEISIEKNKNGEMQSSIVAFIGKVNDLERYSKELKEEVKALRNRKPEIIVKTDVVYMGDTTKIPNSLTDNGNGNYDLNWKYANQDSSRIIEGKSSFNATVLFNKSNFSYKLNIKPGTTEINKDILSLDLVVGVARNKKTGLDEIFVTPKNPNVTIGKLEGAILNRSKNKRFSAGPVIGYGVNFGKNEVMPGTFVGFGIGYSLFKF